MNITQPVLLLVALLICGTASQAAEPLLDSGYRQMYNLEFDAAHRTFAQYERDYPADPFGPVSDAAAYLFGEFERRNALRSEFALKDENFLTSSKPLPADPAARRQFEAALDKTERLARPRLRQSPADPNAMFAIALRLGLHADLYGTHRKA